MLRAFLLALSRNKRLARWVMESAWARRMARRFVAGETLEDAVAVTKKLNTLGLAVSLDHLGEHVQSKETAYRARLAYLQALERIAAEKLDANVSVKLTQLGLDLNDDFCNELIGSLSIHLRDSFQIVRVDMEASAYTQRTIDIVKSVLQRMPSIGIVIQAYLCRSRKDIEELLKLGCRIRLCKGAYRESADIAFPKKRDVDANYIRLMQTLLASNIYHGIATHDEKMIAATKKFARQFGIGKDAFEFQMLYGIRNDLQEKLVHEGYRVRVYVPYGAEWFPYFMRRLAERPANLFFLLRNL